MAQVQNKTNWLKQKFLNRKRPTKATVLSTIIMIVLTLYCIALLALLIWGLLTSFKGTLDYKDFGNKLGWPDDSHSRWPGYYNYSVILSGFKYPGSDQSYISSLFGYISNPAPAGGFTFGSFFLNSFVYCLVGSFAKTFVAFLTGYLVAKYRYKFSKFIYVLMLIIMAIPIVGSVPAMVKLTRDLAIYDSYLGMLILNLNFTGLYFFVFVAYFSEFSDVYLEAAEIDGSNQLRSFFTIVFPMASKIFWTVFLLNFIALWNDYQTPLLYYPNHPTLSFGVYKMATQTFAIPDIAWFGAIETPQRIAGCMILAVPILILFLCTKNALLGNMSAGGIKE